jgi:hypothetical protein
MTAVKTAALRNLQLTPGVDRLSLFDKTTHPAEHPYPSVTVALRLSRIAGESVVADFYERARPHFSWSLVL